MSIKETEVGKVFNYATYYDISGFTSLSLKFTSPSGVESTITNPRITAPATPVNDPDLGTLPANTYMQFLTQAGDFTEEGAWTVCGTYEDATPKVYYGDEATFIVEAKC